MEEESPSIHARRLKIKYDDELAVKTVVLTRKTFFDEVNDKLLLLEASFSY
jgi:hypothetical protein